MFYVWESSQHDVILGQDTFEKLYSITFTGKKLVFHFGLPRRSHSVTLMLADKLSRQQVSPVTLLTNAAIPAEQGQYVKATTQYFNGPESTATDAVFEPPDNSSLNPRLLILPALTKINTDDINNNINKNSTIGPH